MAGAIDPFGAVRRERPSTRAKAAVEGAAAYVMFTNFRIKSSSQVGGSGKGLALNNVTRK